MPAILRNSLPNYTASHTVSGQLQPFDVVVGSRPGGPPWSMVLAAGGSATLCHVVGGSMDRCFAPPSPTATSFVCCASGMRRRPGRTLLLGIICPRLSLCVYLTPRPVMIGNTTIERRSSQIDDLVTIGKGTASKPKPPMAFAPRAQDVDALGKVW